jgi:hypothetical protein
LKEAGIPYPKYHHGHVERVFPWGGMIRKVERQESEDLVPIPRYEESISASELARAIDTK